MNYLCPLPGALRKCGLARVFEAVRLFPAKLRHFLWSAKKSGEKVRDGVEDLAPTGYYYSNVEHLYLDFLRLVFQPLLVGRIAEQRHEALSHSGVVVVDPLAFRLVHHSEIHGAEVYGTERERFEGEEGAEISGLGGDGEQRVFNAHTEASGHIDARLVSDGHAGLEWHPGAATQIFADLLRAFVNAEAVANAVARAVAEVISCLPHGIAGGEVELNASASFGEVAAREADVALQNEGVNAAFFVGDGAEGDGARDVGGAAVILCPAVKQQ